MLSQHAQSGDDGDEFNVKKLKKRKLKITANMEAVRSNKIIEETRRQDTVYNQEQMQKLKNNSKGTYIQINNQVEEDKFSEEPQASILNQDLFQLNNAKNQDCSRIIAGSDQEILSDDEKQQMQQWQLNQLKKGQITKTNTNYSNPSHEQSMLVRFRKQEFQSANSLLISMQKDLCFLQQDLSQKQNLLSSLKKQLKENQLIATQSKEELDTKLTEFLSLKDQIKQNEEYEEYEDQ